MSRKLTDLCAVALFFAMLLAIFTLLLASCIRTYCNPFLLGG